MMSVEADASVAHRTTARVRTGLTGVMATECDDETHASARCLGSSLTGERS